MGHGAVLLLNNTPDTTGLIPEADVKRTAEFGAEIRRRFGKSLAETRSAELNLGGPKRIDHVVSMEAIEHGERVREYAIEGWSDGRWRELSRGSAVGHKRIDVVKAVEVSRVRFRAIRSAGTPMIRRLAVYDSGAAATGNLAPEIYAFRVLKQWDPSALKADDWTTWDIDLTRDCTEAAQYEVDFVVMGGSGLRIRSVTLLHGGAEAPEFVTPASRRNTYTVNITAVGVPIALRAVVRAGRGTDSYGQVTIRRAPGA